MERFDRFLHILPLNLHNGGKVQRMKATHVPLTQPAYRAGDVARILGVSVIWVRKLAQELWGPSKGWRLFTPSMIAQLVVRKNQNLLRANLGL
jgi:hypothetical protein